MPEMNGYQVLETCLQDSELRDIPIIMTSSLDEIDSVVKCVELGAEDYLNKPVNPILLRARVNASLEKNACAMNNGNYSAHSPQRKLQTNC